MPTEDSYREKLDARARILNWWLAGAAVLCTLVAVLATIVLAKGVAIDISTMRFIESELKADRRSTTTDL